MMPGDMWEVKYMYLLSAFTDLQKAAWAVIHETDKIHESNPSPQKYRAPYGSIVELRKLLCRQHGVKSP